MLRQPPPLSREVVTRSFCAPHNPATGLVTTRDVRVEIPSLPTSYQISFLPTYFPTFPPTYLPTYLPTHPPYPSLSHLLFFVFRLTLGERQRQLQLLFLPQVRLRFTRFGALNSLVAATTTAAGGGRRLLLG